VTAIPYTVERRPDTGVNNVTLGVWLFLASEVMLFGGLFSAYFVLRAGATRWPGPIHQALAAVNTVLLFGGTFMMTVAIRGARQGRSFAFRIVLLIAIALLVAFLGVKGLEYRDDLALGLFPRTNTRMALCFLLTGAHALHVIGGILFALPLALAGAHAWTPSPARIVNRAEALGLYWVFVDVIWIVLLVLLYAW